MYEYNQFDLVEIDAARIDEACRAYFLWKDLDTYVRSNTSRGLNFPEFLSESMVCYCLDLYWNKGSVAGDATDRATSQRIEIKASAHMIGKTDLTSFGPREEFDDLVYAWCDTRDNLLYIYDLGLNYEELGACPANSRQTIADQREQGRRPHVSLEKLFIEPYALQPAVVFDIRRCRIIEDNR